MVIYHAKKEGEEYVLYAHVQTSANVEKEERYAFTTKGRLANFIVKVLSIDSTLKIPNQFVSEIQFSYKSKRKIVKLLK